MSAIATGRRAPGQLAVLGPLALLLLLYLLVPVGAFLVRLAGMPASQLQVPGLGGALAMSLETASVSTFVIGVLGVPLAFLLSRSRLRSSTVLGFLVQLPLALPPLVSGILLIYVVGPYTWLGARFGDHLTDTPVGIVIAQVFVAAPFCIVAARSAFGAVEPSLDDVAATLGHGSLGRFWRVWLRGAAAGIGAGLLLAWLRAFGEFGATVLLAYHPYSLPVFTYVQFGSTGLPATMAPVAAALLAPFCLLAVASLLPRVRLSRRRVDPTPAERRARPGGPAVRFDLDARVGTFRLRAVLPEARRRLAILGPSGAGKTFTLRLLAGLERGARTDVWLDGTSVGSLPPERRSIGYVPQDPSLLPGLPVWRQVTFGVDADPGLAAHWLRVLGLSGLEQRRPEQLSGGQRRRVAIARALAISPALLLLDEPFTGLDAPVRRELQRQLRTLQREQDLSTVLVTHDPEEAAMLAEGVLVLTAGEVAQCGDQASVYSHPGSPSVARLLGIQNVWTGEVCDEGGIGAAGVRMRAPVAQLAPGTRVTWCVRPEQVRIDEGEGTPARVVDRIDLGSLVELELLLGGRLPCFARVPLPAAPQLSERCLVDIPPGAIIVWPERRTQRDAVGAPRFQPPREASLVRESPGDRGDPGEPREAAG